MGTEFGKTTFQFVLCTPKSWYSSKNRHFLWMFRTQSTCGEYSFASIFIPWRFLFFVSTHPFVYRTWKNFYWAKWLLFSHCVNLHLASVWTTHSLRLSTLFIHNLLSKFNKIFLENNWHNWKWLSSTPTALISRQRHFQLCLCVSRNLLSLYVWATDVCTKHVKRCDMQREKCIIFVAFARLE